MALFGRSMKEIVDRCRVEVAGEVARLREAGRLIGPDAEDYGTRVERALSFIAVNAPLLPSKAPPAFTELRIAVIENLRDGELAQAANASLDRVEKRVASLLKQEFPALSHVDLGVDDLMEMARAGILLRSRFQSRAREIADGEKGTFLSRVRARKSGAEVASLREDAADVDPRTPNASGRAVALMALEALRERATGVPEVLDPRPPRARKAVTAASLGLMRFAAGRSGDLLPEERDGLRLEIAKAGRNIELASDIEEARREEENSAFPWLARA